MHRLLSAAVALLVSSSALPLAAQQPTRLGAPRTSASAATTPPRGASNLLPGTRSNVFTTIQGNALNSANLALPNSLVRLRDARFGRIVQYATTDQSGLFEFRSLDPGSYIVELLAPDRTTIWAASQILNVDAGEAVSAVVKLPFRLSPFAGLLGHTAASATTVSAAAAASGLMATTVTGEPVSPQR